MRPLAGAADGPAGKARTDVDHRIEAGDRDQLGLRRSMNIDELDDQELDPILFHLRADLLSISHFNLPQGDSPRVEARTSQTRALSLTKYDYLTKVGVRSCSS